MNLFVHTTCPIYIYTHFSNILHSFSNKGHEIVANIAYNRLSSVTKAAVDRILSGNEKFGDSEEETPLGKVANWADKVRFESEFHWTAPLHYVDIPDDQIPGGCHCCQTIDLRSQNMIGSSALNLRSASSRLYPNTLTNSPSNCNFTYNRDCSKDMCVVGAIHSFSNILQCPSMFQSVKEETSCTNPYNTTTSQKQNLMFLTHFVGDIHQPLHVSRKTDKGGNTIEVHFPLQKYTVVRRNDRDGFFHSKWNLQ